MNTPDTFWPLFAGYTAFWLAICLFLWRLMAEQKALKNEIEKLRNNATQVTDKNAHQEMPEKLARVQ